MLNLFLFLNKLLILMKNLKILLPLVFICIVIGNILFYTNVYNKQLNFQEKMLFKHADGISNKIEKIGLSFENDVNYILYSSNLLDVFNSNNAELVAKLKIFYSKYPYLITNVLVYDNNQNVFSLYKDKNDNFLSNIYISRNQIGLLVKERLQLTNNVLTYALPMFRNNKLVGNIVVHIDLASFYRFQLEQAYLGGSFWLMVFDNTGNVLFHQNPEVKIQSDLLKSIIGNINNLKSGSNIYSSKNTNSETVKYLSVYSPISFLKCKHGILCNIDIKELNSGFVQKGILSILWNLILFAFIVLYYIKLVKSQSKEEKNLRESEEAIKQILELMPIGIIIINNLNRIISINKALHQES